MSPATTPRKEATVAGYLVETSFYGEPWQVRSGHRSRASAMQEVRQCGRKWRKEGHAVRVVAHGQERAG